MGTVTSNISIYIPAAGETNYDSSFAAGMVNIDQHDHSGPPTKGVPIAAAGIANGAVTFQKLNTNVVDPTTGIGTSGVNLNQIIALAPLSSIFQLAPASGFIVMNGTAALIQTFAGTPNQIAVTNANGIAGPPTFSLTPVVQNPTQPTFQVFNSAPVTNVTGDGTNFAVTFDTVDYDVGTGFASPNYTAGQNGTYLFTCSIVLIGLLNTHVSGQLFFKTSTGQTQYGMRMNPWAMSDGGNLAIEATSLFKMTAGESVFINLQVSGGTKVVNVFGAALTAEPSLFEGFFLG